MAAKQQWQWAGRSENIRVRIEPARRLALLDAADAAGVLEAEAIRQAVDLWVATKASDQQGKAE